MGSKVSKEVHSTLQVFNNVIKQDSTENLFEVQCYLEIYSSESELKKCPWKSSIPPNNVSFFTFYAFVRHWEQDMVSSTRFVIH